MIPPDGGRDHLTAYLASAIHRRCELPAADCEHLAVSTVHFLEDEGLRHPFPSDLVALAAARSLAAFDRSGAMRFLEDHIDQEDENLLLYRELLLTRPFSYRQWRLVAAGVLSSDAGTATSSLPSYTLHVSRVGMEKEDLELTVFGTIRNLLQIFSGLWESRSGQFHLGIKGLPKKRGRDKSLPSAKEVVDFCRDWFEQLAEEKAWVAAPDITVRDLGTI